MLYAITMHYLVIDLKHVVALGFVYLIGKVDFRLLTIGVLKMGYQLAHHVIVALGFVYLIEGRFSVDSSLCSS